MLRQALGHPQQSSAKDPLRSADAAPPGEEAPAPAPAPFSSDTDMTASATNTAPSHPISHAHSHSHSHSQSTPLVVEPPADELPRRHSLDDAAEGQRSSGGAVAAGASLSGSSKLVARRAPDSSLAKGSSSGRPHLHSTKSASAVPSLSTTSASATTPTTLSSTAASTAHSSGTNTPLVRSGSGVWRSRAASMVGQQGVNAHTAADLLRQAMMQSRTSEEDTGSDQIGSGSSTPPGAATPRPDLVDKRLPGILHTYFGQVRNTFRLRPKASAASTSSEPPSIITVPPAPEEDQEQKQEPPRSPSPLPAESGRLMAEDNPPIRRDLSAASLATLPTSPWSLSSISSFESPPLLPHERIDRREPSPLASTEAISPFRHYDTPPTFYPTPPMSSSSSLHRLGSPVYPPKSNGGDSGYSSRARSSRADGEAEETTAWTSPSKSPQPPLAMRRHTLAISKSLASIDTLTASAAHILNPLPHCSSTPSSPILTYPSCEQSLLNMADQELKKLTGTSSDDQNTPPQSPRTQSQDGKAPSSKLNQISTLSGDTQPQAVGPPKGKLSVSISEGRGIRPAIDPYIVCQFQWAQYISEGPRREGKDEMNDLRNGLGGIAIRRTGSDSGRPMAIPMKSRQSSQTGSSSDLRGLGAAKHTANPRWDHEAIFDVVGEHSEIDVSLYDRSNSEAFLGHIRFCPNLVEYDKPFDAWFPLEPRDGENSDNITGEIRLRIAFHKTEKKHYGPEDFEILKLIGKGTFGQVFQVRKKDTKRIYAMKVLSKKVIVQKKEVAHTLGERNILVRTATSDSPFIVGLKFSFQTPTDLYLVTDYMSGGELFWHLQREGRFQEARAKFYIAELILALQHLHEHDIVYRDLKPENILLDANGHIALCDFGLSKANLTENATTNTFCGTTEYLAPEVLLDEHGYTKMVDFWSLGVLVFEMCCGWSPFYAEDTQQMYKNIAFGKVRFPRDALSTEGRNFVKGLLNRNPRHRLGSQSDAEELKAHPFFADIDWDSLAKKNVVPPFKPKLKGELDVSNFDPEFTNALNGGSGSLNARAAALASGINPASTPLSPTVQANFKGFTFVDESAMERHMGGYGGEDGEAERMDEDNEDDDWERLSPTISKGDRMSGVVDEGVFNHGGFDV